MTQQKQPHRWTSDTARVASKRRKKPYAWSSEQARAAAMQPRRKTVISEDGSVHRVPRPRLGPKLYVATRKRDGRYEYQLPDGRWVTRQAVHLHRLYLAAEAADSGESADESNL